MKTNNLTIEFNEFDHAAMVDDPTGEVVRVLNQLAAQIREYGIPNVDGSRLKDTNGNNIGSVSVDLDEDDEEDVWDGDLTGYEEVRCRYGSGKTRAVMYVDKTNGWYCIQGSINVNRAPDDDLVDDVWVEEIMDVDMFTAGSPVDSLEAFAEMIWKHNQ